MSDAAPVMIPAVMMPAVVMHAAVMIQTFACAMLQVRIRDGACR